MARRVLVQQAPVGRQGHQVPLALRGLLVHRGLLGRQAQERLAQVGRRDQAGRVVQQAQERQVRLAPVDLRGLLDPVGLVGLQGQLALLQQGRYS